MYLKRPYYGIISINKSIKKGRYSIYKVCGDRIIPANFLIMELKDIIKEAVEEAIKNSGFTNNKKNDFDLVGLKEVCIITGYSKHTIYRKTSQRKIPFIKRPGGRKIYFSKKAILDWLMFGKN